MEGVLSNRKLRERIKLLFGGKCAYCGKTLTSNFHVDHIEPIYRGNINKPSRAGTDREENMFPSCPRCNRRKATYTIEEFRYEISLQIDRLRKISPQYRLAEDFGLVLPTENKVIFWFEKYRSAS